MSKARDTGAAAALKRLEDAELAEWVVVQEAQTKLDVAQLLKTEKGEPDYAAVNSAQLSLTESLKRHDLIAKRLLDFEKNVSVESRTGAKWPQRDVEKWLENIATSLRLAQEQVITSYSQDAIKCDSETQVYEIFAPSARRAMKEAIETSVKQLKMPEWAAESLLRGL